MPVEGLGTASTPILRQLASHRLQTQRRTVQDPSARLSSVATSDPFAPSSCTLALALGTWDLAPAPALQVAIHRRAPPFAGDPCRAGRLVEVAILGVRPGWRRPSSGSTVISSSSECVTALWRLSKTTSRRSVSIHTPAPAERSRGWVAGRRAAAVAGRAAGGWFWSQRLQAAPVKTAAVMSRASGAAPRPAPCSTPRAT